MTGHHSETIGRRNFLKGAAAGLVLLPHTDLSAFGLRPKARASTVAIIRTADRKDGVARAMALLNPTGMAGKQVVIKPHFNTAGAAPAGTSNDTLMQLVTELKERDARSITLGEASGPPDTGEVMAEKGIPDLASDMGFDTVNYDEIPDSDWVHFQPSGTHWPEGFHLPRHVVNAEYNVSTCCLKTHGSGGVFTMSMKLSVGLIFPHWGRGNMCLSIVGVILLILLLRDRVGRFIHIIMLHGWRFRKAQLDLFLVSLIMGLWWSG